jgi:predicted RNase H-like HicB family nuclease
MKFVVTLQPGEDGFIIAECPALPGCMTQGRTREEALANIGEAIELNLESRRELGLPIEVDTAEVEVSVPD